MELIERYLQEIGRHLPANKRADILSELRSSLDDSLEARTNGQPSEEAIVQIIKEMGAPRKVAASYYPEGQYLIGPEMFPFFQFIFGIVLAATVGGQLIAAIVSLTVSHRADSIVQEFLEILNSIPAALGSVVLVLPSCNGSTYTRLLRRKISTRARCLPFIKINLSNALNRLSASPSGRFSWPSSMALEQAAALQPKAV